MGCILIEHEINDIIKYSYTSSK